MPLDPADKAAKSKANKEYYESHKHLKGKSGSGQVGKGPSSSSAKTPAKPAASDPKETAARVGRLKAKVATLEGALSKAEAELSLRRQKETKEKKESSDGKSTEAEKQASEKYRDKNQQKLKNDAKKDSAKEGGSDSKSESSSSTSSSSSSLSDMSAGDLEARISKIKSALADAKSQLASATNTIGHMAHSNITSEPMVNEDFARFHPAERTSVKMTGDDADFGGYATRNDLRCSDGRTILADAFKHDDGRVVPLVFQHGHNDIENVLGHVKLENRADGVYCYGYFNETPKGQLAKSQVKHGDLKSLSIFANGLKERVQAGLANAKEVIHGNIREVSLVLAGANPGALIDVVNLAHAEEGDAFVEDAYIYVGEDPGVGELVHAAATDTKDKADDTDESNDLVKILKSLNPEQERAVNYLLAQATLQASESAKHADDEGESLDESESESSEDDAEETDSADGDETESESSEDDAEETDSEETDSEGDESTEETESNDEVEHADKEWLESLPNLLTPVLSSSYAEGSQAVERLSLMHGVAADELLTDPKTAAEASFTMMGIVNKYAMEHKSPSGKYAMEVYLDGGVPKVRNKELEHADASEDSAVEVEDSVDETLEHAAKPTGGGNSDPRDAAWAADKDKVGEKILNSPAGMAFGDKLFTELKKKYKLITTSDAEFLQNDGARKEYFARALVYLNNLAKTQAVSPSGKKRLEFYAEGINVKSRVVTNAVAHSDTNEVGDAVQHDNTNQEDTSMTTHNLFDQGRVATTADGAPATLSHSDVKGIMTAVVKNESTLEKELNAYALEHGITNISYLFPDAKTIEASPQWNSRRMEWVDEVLSNVRKQPFGRIKSIVADITADEARARGYITGHLKEEEFFTLAKRETLPQTVYKKQRLDRDDVIDITDLDVVAFVKAEMKIMLDEEIAGAILIGDGRSSGDEFKIREANIRPIATDSELYATQCYVNIDGEDLNVDALLDSVVENRQYFKGSGTPTFYTSEAVISKFLNLKDGFQRRMYSSLAEVATVLRVDKIVPVEIFDRVPDLVGIMVNLQDYSIGTDRGGQATMFDDFDLNFNKLMWLLETRCSGALTTVKSALVFRKVVGTATLVAPDAPAFNKATGVLTVPNKTGVVYKNADTNATLSSGAQTALAPGATVNVQASPASGYYFTNSVGDSYTFTRNAS